MRRTWQSWLFALLALVIAVCVATLSTRFGFTTDWSTGQRATISAASQSLLAQLEGPLEATAYARPGRMRAKVSLLLDRYRRFKPDLQLRFVDPDLDPLATQAAGITANGEIVLHWRGHEQHVAQLGEQAFSDALTRLVRGGTQLVAFVTGNGERDVAGKGPADLDGFAARLDARGVRVLSLNLAEAAEVPRNASLVVLASPQAALLPGSVRKLQAYVADGGNLLWLTEPGSGSLGLAPLAHALGIKRLPGVLFDEAGVKAGFRDPRMLVVSRYPPQAASDGFHMNTLFPRSAALAALTDAPWKVEPLLQSGAHSRSQATPLDPAQTSSAPGSGPLQGPLNFGYALSRLSPSPAKTQQRAVVIGDGDFLSNRYVLAAGNLAFGERIVDWLLGDDALAGAPRSAPDGVLKPTRTDLAILAFGYLLALPIALILIGLMIGWRRRRR